MATALELAAELRRLTILQILRDDPDYRMNDTLLSSCLKAQGQGTPSAVLLADIAWLQALGLVVTESFFSGTIILLCDGGVDVADGVSVVPGIARPRPQ